MKDFKCSTLPEPLPMLTSMTESSLSLLARPGKYWASFVRSRDSLSPAAVEAELGRGEEKWGGGLEGRQRTVLTLAMSYLAVLAWLTPDMVERSGLVLPPWVLSSRPRR